MFCGKCGTRNPELNKYCRECGAKLPDRQNRILSEEQFADLREPQPPEVIDHNKVAVLMDVAFSYHREGKIDQAIETCLQAVALNNESTSAHSLLALLYEEKGQFDEAVAHLRRVLELNPGSAVDQANLARLLGDTSYGAATAPREGMLARLLSPQARPAVAAISAGLVTLVALSAYALPRLRTASDGDATVPPGNTVAYPGMQRQAPAAGTTAGGTQAVPSTPAQLPAASPLDEEPDLGPPEPAAPRTSAPARRPAAERFQAPAAPPPLMDAEGPVEALPAPRPRTVTTPPVILVPTTPAQGSAGATVQEAATPPAAAERPVEMETSITVAPQMPAQPAGGRAPSRPATESTPDHQASGMGAVARGDYDTAVEHFRKALANASTPRERGQIHQHLAYAYQQLGRSAEAQAEYRQAIAQYQEQLKEGTNADLARAGIRACEGALRMLGM